MNLKDKTFIIYGASSGIGNALAKVLSKDNRVGTFSRRPLPENLREGCHFQGDIAEMDDVKKSTQMFKDKWGTIDGFIYSVGSSQITEFEKFKANDVKSVMDSNFFGFLNVLESLLPDFQSRHSGMIGMVSSLIVHRSLPKGAAYFATKAAQHVFFEGLRLDLETSGIEFFEIRPGLVDTPMAREIGIDMNNAWTAARAADYIVTQIEKGESDISFSKTMKYLAKSAMLMPDSTYFKMARASVNKAMKK